MVAAVVATMNIDDPLPLFPPPRPQESFWYRHPMARKIGKYGLGEFSEAQNSGSAAAQAVRDKLGDTAAQFIHRQDVPTREIRGFSGSCIFQGAAWCFLRDGGALTAAALWLYTILFILYIRLL